MKTFELVALILFALVTGVQAEETDSAAQFTSVNKGPQWTLSIRDDGQLEINGKAVEKMSDPEIKSIMQEIAVWLREQSRDLSLAQQYDRLTEYLLDQLERCRKEKK
jgi:hypothetical protein